MSVFVLSDRVTASRQTAHPPRVCLICPFQPLACMRSVALASALARCWPILALQCSCFRDTVQPPRGRHGRLAGFSVLLVQPVQLIQRLTVQVFQIVSVSYLLSAASLRSCCHPLPATFATLELGSKPGNVVVVLAGAVARRVTPPSSTVHTAWSTRATQEMADVGSVKHFWTLNWH